MRPDRQRRGARHGRGRKAGQAPERIPAPIQRAAARFLYLARPGAPCYGMITITTPARLPPCPRCSVYVSTCLRVYMSTCLHVYKLSSKMAYLSAKTDIQRDKQRQTRTGAIKPRPSYYQPFVSLSRSNNSFCLPASACRFMYSVNAASSSSPLPLPFAFT